MKPREIDVHIDELVLHGFPSGSRQNVAEALQNELSTLLAERGLPGAWQCNPDNVQVAVRSTGSRPATAGMGSQIARAIYGPMT